MKEITNTSKKFKIGLSVLSLILISISIYLLYDTLMPYIQEATSGQVISSEFPSVIMPITIFIIAMVVMYVGKYWGNFAKALSRLTLFVGVFLFIIGLTLLAFDSNVDDFVGSVQPSIDIMVAGQFDSLLTQNTQILDGKKVNVAISENSTINVYYNENLTLEQANSLTQGLGFDLNSNDDDKIMFAQIFITILHEEISSNYPEYKDNPIPLSLIEEMFSENDIDFSTLSNIDAQMLEEVYPIDNTAHIKVLMSENLQNNVFVIGEMTKQEINLIWDNMGFDNSISYQTKSAYIDIIFSEFAKQMDMYGQNISIPISSLASIVPSEMSELFKYDFMTENFDIRVANLVKLRSDCQDGKYNSITELEEVCESVMMTKYDYLMEKLPELANTGDVEIPLDIDGFVKDFGTLDKIKSMLKSFSSYWLLFSIFGFLIIISSFLIQVIGNHFSQTQYDLIKIFKDFSYAHLMHALINFLLIFLLYLFIASEIFSNLINSLIGLDKIIQNDNVTLPFFEVFIKMFSDSALYIGIYFAISALLFLIAFTIHRNRGKSALIENTSISNGIGRV